MSSKNEPVKIKVEYEIDDDAVKSLLDSIVESGAVSYWAELIGQGYDEELKKKPYLSDIPFMIGGMLYFKDIEADTYILDYALMKYGLAVMAEKYTTDFADLLYGEPDNITADIFLQCCFFGEVKYS